MDEKVEKEDVCMKAIREMQTVLKDNGYKYVRCRGSHFIYSDGVNTIAVNKDLNRMVAKRLVKQYHLIIKQ